LNCRKPPRIVRSNRSGAVNSSQGAVASIVCGHRRLGCRPGSFYEPPYSGRLAR
jgi:hypothetical protein